MNLVIDYGNSAAKVGIFDHQNLMEKQVVQSEEALKNFFTTCEPENIIVSSVKTNAGVVASWVKVKGRKFILDKDLPMPVKNLYKTPETLGVDRLAGVCGAQQIFPFQNCLVIDAGTCITYDFVDKDGAYYGGGISPGLRMRFQAMHTLTARLTLVELADEVNLIGDSTETSLQSGTIHGAVAEIEGIIQRYQSQFAGLKVILCGGDTLFFENKLKASIFASPELVLVGLNSILNYNVTLK